MLIAVEDLENRAIPNIDVISVKFNGGDRPIMLKFLYKVLRNRGKGVLGGIGPTDSS